MIDDVPGRVEPVGIGGVMGILMLLRRVLERVKDDLIAFIEVAGGRVEVMAGLSVL